MILGLLASEIVQLPATNASILHSVNASNASNATNATAATHAADAATALSDFPSYSSQPSAFNTTIWASTIMPTTVLPPLPFMPPPPHAPAPGSVCLDTCQTFFLFDGICDDGGSGSSSACALWAQTAPTVAGEPA